MSNPAFAPLDESPMELWLEKSNFVGATLGAVAYGVHAAVFFACIYFLKIREQRQRQSRESSWWHISYIFALFAMGTLNMACNTRFSQLMWIDNRNIPGGPNAWLTTYYNTPVNIAGNAGYIISNFLADALLLYRLKVVWSHKVWVVIFPTIIFLVSTAMSILTLYQVAQPGASLWSNTTISFALPYWTISLSLNMIVTAMIVARIWVVKSRIGKSIGQEHVAAYTSIISMVVESAAMYSIVGLIFIITYALNSYVQNLVLPVLGQVMCIAPELIVLRVALGRAWRVNTGTSNGGTYGSSAPGASLNFVSGQSNTVIDVELASRGAESKASREFTKSGKSY